MSNLDAAWLAANYDEYLDPGCDVMHAGRGWVRGA
jgi:hypothetical protein